MLDFKIKYVLKKDANLEKEMNKYFVLLQNEIKVKEDLVFHVS